MVPIPGTATFLILEGSLRHGLVNVYLQVLPFGLVGFTVVVLSSVYFTLDK